MIPRSLELEGIRSFIAPHTIDFSDLGLFAILGDTGAGKSSILEAMVYALFNGTTWDGRGAKELMSTGATRMRVRFSFSLNDRTYTVSRSTPREGPASHLLECEGMRDERRDGENAVTKRLEQLLGLDRETFTKTVVLPQGEFAALLTLADKPARRTELLTTILGLDRLDAMVNTLAVPRERAKALREQLRGARSRLPADPAAAIAETQVAIETALQHRTSIEAALAKLDERERTLFALNAATAKRAEVRERLATVPAGVARLETLVASDADLGALVAAANERYAAADLALRRINAELPRRVADGRDAATLASVHATLDKLIDAYEERRRESDDLAQRRANLATAGEAVTAGAAEYRHAEAAAAAAGQNVGAARSALTVATAAWQTAQTASGNLAQARASAADVVAAVMLCAAAVEHNAAAHDQAVAENDSAAAALGAADALLVELQRANAAAFAAQSLTPGDPCPICDRPIPHDFSPHAAPDLERAQRAAQEARKRAQSAQKRLGQAETARETATRSHAESVSREVASQDDLDRAITDARAAGLDADGNGTAPLTALQTAADERQAALVAAETESLKAVDARAAARSGYNAAVSAQERANQEINSCLVSIERRDRAIDGLLEVLPSAFRPAIDGGVAAAHAACAQAAHALADARAFDQTRTDAALTANNAATALRMLEAQRDAEIAGPLQAVRSDLTAAVTALRSYAAQGASPAPPSDAEPPAALAWAQSLAVTVSSTLATITAADVDDLRRSSNESAAIETLLRENGITSRAALSEQRDLALQAEAVARQAVEIAQHAAGEAAGLDVRLGTLEPLARALDALHAALGDGKFKGFVAARKEQRLLGVATTILGRMTDDRYGFGAGMRIVDRSAGQERSPQTLSGGEKFLASLALAFALVEIAARSGGQFGALFLDEGFGSLDLRALDQALSELERQAAGGRMIGVITHVREVSEYIDDVLRVQRTPSGSDVTRLGRADLDALVAETATLAIGNA